jgi:CheY-like chemotaxis protein
MAPKILVVDDEERNVKLLKAILLTEQYKAYGVSSGQEALDAVSRLEAGPHPAGRDDARHGRVRGVQAADSGADDFLSKPVDRTELLIRVKSLLRIKRLHNAIRHTPQGGSIAVRLEGEPEKGALRISVQDYGDGLPQEYLEKVFDRFEQARLKSEGISVGSNGLGLAFWKMAVEAHGGRIWVESAGRGEGCPFHIELPPHPRPPPAASPVTPAKRGGR